jgi:hypothetical protein
MVANRNLFVLVGIIVKRVPSRVTFGAESKVGTVGRLC